MLSSTLTHLHWLFRLSVRFIKGAPVETISVVIMTLISQIFGMVAFLLPIKIVMLLGSSRIPRIFPEVFLQFERNELVLMLCGIALACFVVNVFVSKAIVIVSDKGAKKLQAKAEKVALFKNQTEIALKSYSHYVEALASLAFTSLAVALLAYLYSDAAYFLSGYILLCLVSVIVGVYLFPSSFEEVRSDSSSLISNLNNVGFFAVFVYVVIDFLYMSPPAFFVAMFSMIMTRRLQGLLGKFISRLISLSKNKQKVDALFFHNKVYIQSTNNKKKDFWGVMVPEVREKWLKELFLDLENSLDEMEVLWLKLRKNGVIGLKVTFGLSGNSYLVKLFDTPATYLAKHEKSILTEFSSQIATPEPIKFTSISGYKCNLFNITNLHSIEKSQFSAVKQKLFIKQLEFKPPRELVQRYKRSKLMLWKRITDEMFARSILIADKEQLSQIKQVKNALPEILERISRLPLVLMTELGRDAHKLTYYDKKGALIASWGAWFIEPVGYGCRFEKEELIHFLEGVKSASENRPELKRVNGSDVAMVVILSELERKFLTQSLIDSFDLLSKLLTISNLNQEVMESQLIKVLFGGTQVSNMENGFDWGNT